MRKLADRVGKSQGWVHKRLVEEMDALPENAWLTKEFCICWSGILVIDGKHVKVKGYDKKIPYVWGIDFLSHDFPLGVLGPSESSELFCKYFRLLKSIGYPLRVVICDDVVSALQYGLFRYFPKAKIQLCHVHYLENIRSNLTIRTDKYYRPFFTALEQGLFSGERDRKTLQHTFHDIWGRFAKTDHVVQDILLKIDQRQKELFQYTKIPNCPRTTNIMECMNSHLNGRLKTTKGFQSFHDANRFLNAYLLRRRTKTYTDCNAPFKHCNGMMPIQLSTNKKETNWSSILPFLGPRK